MAGVRTGRPRARAAVIPLPVPSRGRLSPRAFVPSGRSLAVGVAVLALAGAGYAVARWTSLFAVREVRVEGATPALARQVRSALQPLAGRSLLALDHEDVLGRVEAVPEVRSASYDRAFPNAVVVTVRRERAAAVLRRGAESWLLSARGRVIRSLRRGDHPRLPRIWVRKSVQAAPGARVRDRETLRAVRALAPLARDPLPVRVQSVRAAPGELTFRLGSGLELRLGDETELPLKLAVAHRIVRILAPPCYLDLSVPERPVACPEPQVGG